MFKPEKFKGKKACVLGLGRSGKAVAELLAEKGFSVLLSEEKKVQEIPVLSKAVTIETGGHTEEVLECDFIVKSPGIFPQNTILRKAKKKKIPVFSEMEIALSFAPADICLLAISGTNGKTTTTSLLGEILKEYGSQLFPKRNVFVGGNIGTPLSELVKKVKSRDFLVLEVSSYQLEDSSFFRPKVACLLNITPDHLDHHGGMEKYIKAKARLFKNQRSNDFSVLNGGDELCAGLVKKIKGELIAFSASAKHSLKTDVFYDGDEIIFSAGYRLTPPRLKGIHNVENAMAAALCALEAGVPAATIQRVFKQFKPIEHRIETVLKHKGVLYVNDSKATNLDSTVIALKSFEKTQNIWLILGGRDKGASYEILLPYLKDYCKKVLTIGESMDKIEKDLEGKFPLQRCETLKKAVLFAAKNAQKGDVVLLSPACASFDQFKDYEQRGNEFKKLVKKLGN